MRLPLSAACLAAALLATPAFACETQVAFKRGEQQASYKGQIAGDSLCSYFFTARADQKVTVWLTGSKGLDAILFGDSSETFENGVPVTLETGGRQEIRVLQNRNAARKSKAAKPYNIRIAISDK